MKKLQITFFVLALFGLLTVAHAAQHTIVITIEDYRTTGASNLPGCHRDGDNFANLLSSKLGFKENDIIRLRDQEATTKRIEEVIKEISDKAQPEDAVVIYFSGHGTKVPDIDGDEGDGFDECIVTTSFNPRDPKTWLTDDRIGVALAAFKTPRVTLIVDACHSGTIERSLGDTTAKYASFGFEGMTSKMSTNLRSTPHGIKGLRPAAVFTACDSGEVAALGRFDELAQSRFTYFFTKIAAENVDTSLEQLFANVRKAVANDAKLRNHSQTVQFTGLEKETLVTVASGSGTLSTQSSVSSPTTPPPSTSTAQTPSQENTPSTSGGGLPSAFPIKIAVDQEVYAHNSLMNIKLLSPRSGYIRIYYIDQDKRAYVIYPNHYNKDARIIADEVLSIPGELPFKFRIKHKKHGTPEAQSVNEILLAVIGEVPFTDDEALLAETDKNSPFKSLGDVTIHEVSERGIETRARSKVARTALIYTIKP